MNSGVKGTRHVLEVHNYENCALIPGKKSIALLGYTACVSLHPCVQWLPSSFSFKVLLLAIPPTSAKIHDLLTSLSTQSVERRVANVKGRGFESQWKGRFSLPRDEWSLRDFNLMIVRGMARSNTKNQ